MNTVMLAAGAEAGAEVAKSAMDTVIAAMADVFTLSGTVVSSPSCCSVSPLVWFLWVSASSPA